MHEHLRMYYVLDLTQGGLDIELQSVLCHASVTPVYYARASLIPLLLLLKLAHPTLPIAPRVYQNNHKKNLLGSRHRFA